MTWQLQDILLAYSAQILLGFVIGGIAMVMLAESMVPFRALSANPLPRWFNNLALTGLDYAILFSLAPLLSMLIGEVFGLRGMGLLNLLETDSLAAFLILFLCLELMYYWIHRGFHTIPALWRIHAVHHSDTEVDATTTHRHHPLEPLINTLLAIPVLLILGPEPILMLIYNALRTFVAVISHGNFSFHPAIEQVLRRFVVTPDFHRQHHRTERHYTDSNYASVLPLFDHLFGTATQASRDAQLTMPLGLEYLREPRDARLDRLLILPFLPVFSTLPTGKEA